MKIIADFHIHSKFSRATSRDMDVDHLRSWAKKKGINLLGTGDFTHPGWLAELKQKLVPKEDGIYGYKGAKHENLSFILTGELSCIYTKDGKVRKIHLLIFVPSLKDADKINATLTEIGNIWSDGRPIFGANAKRLAEIIWEASPETFIVPAHAWTPWFSVFGSNSGFDTLEECFEEFTPRIKAIETGLSSDPKMNWRLSQLDNISLISNSDAHSPAKIGREANVFNFSKLTYKSVIEAISQKNPKNFLYTIEFFPEEGKYHFDGHRACGVRFSPEETIRQNNICPECGKPLTVGVMNRVAKLADRKLGFTPKNAIPGKYLVPLAEILSEILEVGDQSKTVKEEYDRLINLLGPEINILSDVHYNDLAKAARPELIPALKRLREEKVEVEPGYDGVFGKVKTYYKDDLDLTKFTLQPEQESLF